MLYGYRFKIHVQVVMRGCIFVTCVQGGWKVLFKNYNVLVQSADLRPIQLTFTFFLAAADW